MACKLKYPKLGVFALTIILAYLIFQGNDFLLIHNFLLSLGYWGIFIAGLFYTYGFTSAPATAVILILAKEQNIYLAGLIGGLGSLIGDLFIFRIIRFSLDEEIKTLFNSKYIQSLSKKIPRPIKKYLWLIMGMLFIASPLPDELGILFLASTKISTKLFSVISSLLNTLRITLILMIGKAI